MLEAHILAILILGVSCFIIGSIPFKLSRWTRQPFMLSILLCCGGGVLLATSIVHMLAEVREKMPTNSELIFCGGFLLLYAFDEFLHLCIKDNHLDESDENKISRRSSTSSEDLMKIPIVHQHRTSYGAIDKLPKRARFYSLSQSFQTNEILPHNRPSTSFTGIPQQTQHPCCRIHQRERSFQKTTTSNHNREEKRYRNESSDSSSDWSSLNQCHIEVKQPCPKQNKSSISGLLAALLIHSLLEGLSIGVQTDSTEVLLILGAVACHKLVLAFCLGMEMASAGYEGIQYILAIAAFSVGCPIGIGFGVSLNNSTDGVFLVEAPLQAVAAGSLLYVAVFEVLPREKFKWQHKPEMKFATFIQMISVLIGFSVIIGLNILFNDVHSHP